MLTIETGKTCVFKSKQPDIQSDFLFLLLINIHVRLRFLNRHSQVLLAYLSSSTFLLPPPPPSYSSSSNASFAFSASLMLVVIVRAFWLVGHRPRYSLLGHPSVFLGHHMPSSSMAHHIKRNLVRRRRRRRRHWSSFSWSSSFALSLALDSALVSVGVNHFRPMRRREWFLVMRWLSVWM